MNSSQRPNELNTYFQTQEKILNTHKTILDGQKANLGETHHQKKANDLNQKFASLELLKQITLDPSTPVKDNEEKIGSLSYVFEYLDDMAKDMGSYRPAFSQEVEQCLKCLAPISIRANLKLAKLYSDQGNISEAMACLKDAYFTADKPKDITDTHFRFDDENLKGAVESIKKQLVKNPDKHLLIDLAKTCSAIKRNFDNVYSKYLVVDLLPDATLLELFDQTWKVSARSAFDLSDYCADLGEYEIAAIALLEDAKEKLECREWSAMSKIQQGILIGNFSRSLSRFDALLDACQNDPVMHAAVTTIKTQFDKQHQALNQIKLEQEAAKKRIEEENERKLKQTEAKKQKDAELDKFIEEFNDLLTPDTSITLPGQSKPEKNIPVQEQTQAFYRLKASVKEGVKGSFSEIKSDFSKAGEIAKKGLFNFFGKTSTPPVAKNTLTIDVEKEDKKDKKVGPQSPKSNYFSNL